MDFQKDITPGIYVICISSNFYSYSGTFRGDFIGFISYAKFNILFEEGNSIQPFELNFVHVVRLCNKVIYMRIIEGELPPGLIMTQLGNIEGILPNLDCIKYSSPVSPSQNWYFKLDNNWYPYGYQWRFKVLAWLADIPEVTDERWFCIRIHNNWSWDRDNFNPPFDKEIEIPEIIKPKHLPNLCCPEKEIPKFIPKPVLCPCDFSKNSEEISKNLQFLQWYKEMKKNQNQGENNPFIQEFLENFKKIDYYKQLVIEIGFGDDLKTSKEKEIETVEKQIDDYLSKLVNGRNENDLDSLMLKLQNIENQKLPIMMLSQTGSSFFIDNLFF